MSGMSAKITERRREGRKGQMGGCTVVLECKTRVHRQCKGSASSAKSVPAVQREHKDQNKGSMK